MLEAGLLQLGLKPKGPPTAPSWNLSGSVGTWQKTSSRLLTSKLIQAGTETILLS